MLPPESWEGERERKCSWSARRGWESERSLGGVSNDEENPSHDPSNHCFSPDDSPHSWRRKSLEQEDCDAQEGRADKEGRSRAKRGVQR